MKKILTSTIVATVGFVLHLSASAQFPISIPKIPKIEKAKPSATPMPTSNRGSSSNGNGEQNSSAAAGSDNLDWGEVKNPAYLSERDTVKEVLKQVKAYVPGSGKRIVTGSGYEYDWFNASISPKYRAEKMKTWTNLQPKFRKWFDDNLDEIGKIASEKLTSYLPNPSAYPVRNPAEERLMKAALSEMPGIVVHKIGLQSAAWIIDKDAFGIPKNRFKYGAVYGKNPSADDPFCEVWYVNIIQDYAGGGTYGSSYAKWVSSETFGCPQVPK
ncbi:MAG: hypothetical protein ACJ72Z_09240 [Pyrinomonadaceae bacterium]